MAITPRPITTAYENTVYSFIKREEALVRRIYSDPLGIPTLGVGYALIVRMPAGSILPFQIRDTLIADLAAIGITWVPKSADDVLLATLLNNLNAGNGSANIGTGPNQVSRAIITTDVDGNPIEHSLNSAGLNEFSFPILADTQVRDLYDISITRARDELRDQFTKHLTRLAATDPTISSPVIAASSMFAGLDRSNEMLALSSLAFNAPGLIGYKLTTALWYQDRAEVWYEIRYNSGASHASRRYKESDKFSLYNEAPTETDYKSAYRTYTRHAEDIWAYENFYPPGSSSTPIRDQLESARNYLTTNYIDLEGIGITVDWNHIQIGESTSTLYYRGTDADLLTGSNQSDLLLAESGNDVLEGAQGDDVLYGGDGLDLYRYNPNDGNDTILDSRDPTSHGDGQGVLVYDPNLTTQGLSVGLREADASGNYSGPWQDPGKTFTYQWSGTDGDPLTITIPGGTLTLPKYYKNDLSIRLIDLPIDPVADDLEPAPRYDAAARQQRNGTEGNDRVGAPDVNDVDGDGNTTELLNGIRGTAGPEIITGQAGDDDIFGNGGGDRLDGGDNDDRIEVGTGSSVTAWADGGIGRIAAAQHGNDYLDGGSGNDELYGMGGDDVLLGGEGLYGGDVTYRLLTQRIPRQRRSMKLAA